MSAYLCFSVTSCSKPLCPEYVQIRRHLPPPAVAPAAADQAPRAAHLSDERLGL